MSISLVSGLTSTQKAVAATTVTAGALIVALGAFALLKGYVPLVGCINFSTARTFVVLGGAVTIAPSAGIYGLKKINESTPESEEVVKKETEARIAVKKELDNVKELEKIAAQKASAVLKASKDERIGLIEEFSVALNSLLQAAKKYEKSAKAAREAAEERAKLSKKTEVMKIMQEAKTEENKAKKKVNEVEARLEMLKEFEMKEYTAEILLKS